MSACPSRLELSLWEARPEPERPADLALHVEKCGRCTAIFAEIADARMLLLGPDPALASARAARAIMEVVRQRKDKRRWLRFLAPAFLVPAAAALLLVARPILRSRGDASVDDGRAATAIKGGLILEAYCKRGGDVFPALDGADFLQGDRLRFAYSKESPGFILVFGVDDQGRVFPYYDEHALTGVPVEAGARVLLPGSVELDEHKGWERIFALWSEHQLGDDVVRATVRAALSTADSDIRRVTVLDLPVEQMSFLLRRP